MKRILALLILILGAGPVQARDVLVRILSNHPARELRLTLLAPARARVGERDVAFQAGDVLRVEAVSRLVAVTSGERRYPSVTAFSVRCPALLVGQRRYQGTLTIRAPGATLDVIDGVDLESYVAGVTAAEALPGAPLAALQAQAVAARSFATQKWGQSPFLPPPRHPAGAPKKEGQSPFSGPHADEGYDFCDLTHCQSFPGLPSPGHPAWEAARATQDVILYRSGRPLAAYYHSTCGGHTASHAEIYGSPDAAYPGVSDLGPDGRAWCARSPHFRWKVDVSAAEVCRALHLATLSGIRVVERGVTGRAVRIDVGGTRLSGYDAWLALGAGLGWGRVESPWLDVRRVGDDYVFSGRGLGHGLGMCQWGAVEMARRGWNMRAILRHYYPGSTLDRLSRNWALSLFSGETWAGDSNLMSGSGILTSGAATPRSIAKL